MRGQGIGAPAWVERGYFGKLGEASLQWGPGDHVWEGGRLDFLNSREP